MVGKDELDRLAKGLAAEILDRQLHGLDDLDSAKRGERRALVIQDADLHDAIASLRRTRDQRGKPGGCQ